ncbi:amino acid/amide ABC transporter membrane protein 1, HAAT family [Tistlia consotensis]|uniref:Amino acid/amide ABC transporter membrane protein 1, HAAT family n=1 Tax=Tistlia consotensis USBA 355 TaxID=560819 RepID=A0A1Y6CJ48_9PROT|nr:branched-chain amino acid ABC transporter permease [Tistlia consotensis]SMF69275.1 amino acid/amide ABC transporter membrane protein 1, HAAT family [Tistlia consotensis USBA 355]SNS02035.1 amino acid/amide ABC transporter membrane protein 1, HAAT family [Tistlia consotensis]
MLDNLLILVQAPTITVDLVLNGILVGAIFALAAYGMALVWGVMNIINIAQGEFVMLGGYVAVIMSAHGVHPLLAVPVAAVLLFGLGWLLYRTVIFRIVERDLFTSILATFGISIVLQQLMNTVFGGDVQVAQAHLGTLLLMGGMVTLAQIKLLSFALAAVLAVVLVLFLRRSRLGQAIRATAQNARAARVLGIDTDRVYAATFGLNAALCGACGALVAMAYTVHPYIGLPYTIRSFMIVIVAGLGNLAGVIAAGLSLGAAENVAGFVLGTQYQLAFVFLLLVVVLVWRNWRLARKRQYLK